MKTTAMFLFLILATSLVRAEDPNQCGPFQNSFMYTYHTASGREKRLIYRTMKECAKAKDTVDKILLAAPGEVVEVCGCEYSAHVGLIFIALPPVPTTQVTCYLIQQSGKIHHAPFSDAEGRTVYSGAHQLSQCETELKRVMKAKESIQSLNGAQPKSP